MPLDSDRPISVIKLGILPTSSKDLEIFNSWGLLGTAFYGVSIPSFIIQLWPNLIETGSFKTIAFSYIYILHLTILVCFAA